MTQSKSSGTQNEQSGKPQSETEADAKSSVKQHDKSSHDHMSREKAGSHEGAGGGAKQEQKH
ncbi:hypothetical protein [Massilia sp. TWR1-2-2]|uniref:hypothetical protein n=1 Tax=Massilia sp. TWR1-2-2 TaxID=2804584 RepID=UPI003CF021C7